MYALTLCKNESTEIFESKSQPPYSRKGKASCCVRTNLQKFLKANHNSVIYIKMQTKLCKNESTEIFESKSQRVNN